MEVVNKVIEPLTLVGIRNWLNEEFKIKKSGQIFKIEDVQGYIRRGYIPRYLGNYKIEKIVNKYNKAYRLKLVTYNEN